MFPVIDDFIIEKINCKDLIATIIRDQLSTLET